MACQSEQRIMASKSRLSAHPWQPLTRANWLPHKAWAELLAAAAAGSPSLQALAPLPGILEEPEPGAGALGVQPQPLGVPAAWGRQASQGG